MSLPASSYSNLFQFAYVVRDIGAAADELARTLGVAGLKILEFTLNLSYPPGKTVLKVGLAWIGDHEIELIEPVEDASGIFASAQPSEPGALAFHHFAMRVPGDMEDWNEFRASIPDAKVAIAGGREGMRFIYVDERATIGHHLEYIWMGPEYLAANPHRIPPSQR